MMKGSPLLASIAKRLDGKVAVITGGASGIGQKTARLFARHGGKVVIADIQDDLGQSLCEEIGSDEAISFVHCDVSSEIDVQHVVDAAVAKYGKLDIMFSNAGIGGIIDPSITTFDYQNLKTVLDVNVLGAFLCAKHAARVMIPAKKGSILFTSSAASVTAGLASHAYTTSKHAVVGLTKNLCVELGQHGIRVNCISPYLVKTPLSQKALRLTDEGADELIMESGNLKGVSLGAEEVAEAAMYLGSDESKYVSGLNLVLDGGYSTTNPALLQVMKKTFS